MKRLRLVGTIVHVTDVECGGTFKVMITRALQDAGFLERGEKYEWACPACEGSGTVIDGRCAACNGKGFT